MAGDGKGLRRYAATIERALALFDSNSEWADYIAFLSRLAKSIEAGKPAGFTEIPLKGRVASCLSRCLQPSLPAGVHQKALDVYAEIFSIIGVEGLSRDLSLFLPGLFHTLAFANLSTRPLILNLYNDFVLEVPAIALRPSLKALLLSLLPALEEETSEDFDRSFNTFESIRGKYVAESQESFFWQTLFVASISSNNRRPGVLVYLTRSLPHLTVKPQAETLNGSSITDAQAITRNAIVSPEPGLLVRCFATGLRDDNALVQRGFLDLLVTHLPLNAQIFQNVSYEKDLDVLVSAAIMVVLRRDMSLNRRLWTWFTGTDKKSSEPDSHSLKPSRDPSHRQEDNYFEHYGQDSLLRSLNGLISTDIIDAPSRALPYRVVLSMLDREEVGVPIVRALFTSLLKSLQQYQASAPTQTAFDEAFRSANALFNGVDAVLIFEQLNRLLHEHDIDILSFIVSNFSLEESEMINKHIPAFCLNLAKEIFSIRAEQNTLAEILDDLMMLIPLVDPSKRSRATNADLEQLLELLVKAFLAAPDAQDSAARSTQMSQCLGKAIQLSPTLKPIENTRLVQTLTGAIQSASTPSELCKLAKMLSTIASSVLQSQKGRQGPIYTATLDALPLIVRSFWKLLSPISPQFHVVSAEEIWRLHDLTEQSAIVSSSILDIFSLSTRSNDAIEDAISSLTTFWAHTKSIRRISDETMPLLLLRPSLLIVDNCLDSRWGENGRKWLLSLPSLTSVTATVLDVDYNDTQEVVLTLNRLATIIAVLRSSEAEWKRFAQSADLPKIYGLCLSLISSESLENRETSKMAFSLLRAMFKAETKVMPPESLISFLVEKLAHSEKTGENEYQSEVLDTLLDVLRDGIALPPSIVQILLDGITITSNDQVLDKWITILCNYLPRNAALLPNLIKVTACFCDKINSSFDKLKALFASTTEVETAKHPERSLTNLLSGLEYILARAHQQVVVEKEDHSGSTSAPGEVHSSRSRANNRLTVVLCMQDAVKVSAKLWVWRTLPRSDTIKSSAAVQTDYKSFQYMAIKLRARSRKLLEHLVEAESQECLETLIGMWSSNEQGQILELLQSLDGARPQYMMPAIFNAVYNRTNRAVLDGSQKSSMSISLKTLDLVQFLTDYTTALEDDMLEEIWKDCSSFLKEVLSNPMPHRQLLVPLLEFLACLAKKMDNTTYGEESRMRKEIADLTARLFTAIFTIKPAGFDGGDLGNESNGVRKRSRSTSDQRSQSRNALSIYCNTLPRLNSILARFDRSSTIYTGIATHIVGPSMHSRQFPANVTIDILSLMMLMSENATATKIWRKDALDSTNNTRLFQSPLPLAVGGWLPLFRQLNLSDKTIFAEGLNRLSSPSAAGIMFGVGATAARTEADRKTQFDMRRIITFILACDDDTFAPALKQILNKVEELLTATPESSPSQATRGDVYLLCRALLLKFDWVSLSALWPILDSELRELCQDLLKATSSSYNMYSKLQGAKLLDLLLLVRPDEFQLHEWLFVTDTIDAIYPPANVKPTSYADEMALAMNTADGHYEAYAASSKASHRRPWLCSEESRNMDKAEQLLAGFFSQLSIRAFEDIYSLQVADIEACKQDLIADVFSEGKEEAG